MKRKLTVLIFILFLTAVPVNCLAFQNEPNGFRDLYWGETLQEVQKKHTATYVGYNSESNSVAYTVPLIDKNIGGIYFGNIITLGFWNNQLFAIYIVSLENNITLSNEIYKKLLNSMTVNYGAPTVRSQTDYINNCNSTWWHGNTTTITLRQNLTPDPIIHKYIVAIGICNNNLLDLAYKDGASRGW